MARMTLPWPQIIQACCVVFGGSVLQGAVGFGMSMFSISILIWLGMPVQATVAMLVVASGFHTFWSWQSTRAHSNWREVVPMAAIRILFLPLGIILLGVLSGQQQRSIKQLVGAIILIILAAQWAFKIKPRHQLSGGWMWLAGSASGFLTGLIDMGGSPQVMWVMAHDWPTLRARGFLWLSYLMQCPFAIVLLWLQFGHPILGPMLLGALFTPVVVAGSILGVRLGGYMSRGHLRLAMTILLAMIGVTSLILG
jgi:uncharacterized membrane protein YfcA